MSVAAKRWMVAAGLMVALMPAVGRGGTVVLDESMAVRETGAVAYLNGVIGAGMPNAAVGLGPVPIESTDTQANATAESKAQVITAVTTNTLDAVTRLGDLTFHSDHSLNISTPGGDDNGGSASSVDSYIPFSLAGNFKFTLTYAGMNLSSGYIGIYDPLLIQSFAEVNSSSLGALTVELGTGNYVLRYRSIMEIPVGTSESLIGESTATVNLVASSVPLPAGWMGGTVVLAGLSLRRKR